MRSRQAFAATVNSQPRRFAVCPPASRCVRSFKNVSCTTSSASSRCRAEEQREPVDRGPVLAEQVGYRSSRIVRVRHSWSPDV